ncbi:hypothetical protein BDV93DRAFT_366924 [Ceratobasidium sp. AG-I]|nr:hypothetical protein BDV93DRAFT_366924 [Ceratobasidium sp. AG-I]
MLQSTHNILPYLGAPMLCNASKVTRANLLPTRDTLTLVNRLPPEVLQHIFAALPLCVHDIDNEVPLRVGSVDTIAEVCSYWRHVAFNSAFLWAHIDLTVGSKFDSLYQRSRVLLERSRGGPIHLHISDMTRDMGGCYEPQALDLTKHVAPHLNRVHSLDIHTRAHPHCVIHPMNAFWRSNGIIGSTKALSIRQPGSNGLVILEDISQAASGPGSQEHSSELLLSLSTLHLQNVQFPWDSSAYRGLVDLRLDFTAVTDVSVSQSTFAEILASSPRLATLKLNNLLITQTPDWNQSTSYRLDYLQVLNVLAMDPESLSLLLPMISLSQSAGSLSIGMPIHTGNKFAKVVESFLNRSCIATLHLVQHDTSNDIAHIMPLLKHIIALERLSLQYDTSGQHTPPTPCDTVANASEIRRSLDLNELYIVSKSVDLEKIQPLISMYGVQTLYLVGCELHVGSSVVTFEEFQKLLFQKFPNTNCVLSSESATADWPCCTIFDDRRASLRIC